MIQVRVRAFHLDHMVKCAHGRVTCRACGLDPLDAPSPIDRNAPAHNNRQLSNRPDFSGSVFNLHAERNA